MRLAWICAFGTAAAVLAPTPARGASKIDLTFASCEAGEQAEVTRLVAIELDLATSSQLESRDGSARVLITCRGSVRILEVFDTTTDKTLARQIDLQDSPDKAWPRFVALGVTELVTFSWSERAFQARRSASAGPTSAARPAPTPASNEAQPRDRSAVTTNEPLSIGVTAARRLFPTSDEELWGFGGVLSWPRLAAFVGVGLEAGAAWGDERRLALGTSKTQLADFAVIAWLPMEAGALVATLGAGARAGVARVTGIADSASVEATSFRAFWGGPLLQLSAGAMISRRLRLSLSGEAGLSLAEANGLQDGVRASGLRGAWTSLGANILVVP